MFSKTSAMQTAWLHGSSAVQRLDTAVQCTLRRILSPVLHYELL